jgi:hypothetical protein
MVASSVSSSLSTFLDTTRGGPTTPGPSQPGEQQTTDTATAAKVLAAIRAGAEVVAEIPAKTGLSTETVLSAVAWLSESGLVNLDSSDGALRAQLTDAAKAALEA